MSRTLLWTAVLTGLLIGCTQEPTGEDLHEAQIADAVREAVFDAACYCEARLLVPGLNATPATGTTSRRTYLLAPWDPGVQADANLLAYASSPSRYYGGETPYRYQCNAEQLSPNSPHAALPTRTQDANERQIQGCAGGVAIDGSTGVSYTPGFCRADFNYCLAQELRLRAESLARPTADVAVRDAILAESRARAQSSAIESLQTLRTLRTTCSTLPSTSPLQGECARANTAYETTLVRRSADVASQIGELAQRETVGALARADALSASDVTSGTYTDAVWGPSSARMSAARRLLGAAPVVANRVSWATFGELPLDTTQFTLVPTFFGVTTLAVDTYQNSRVRVLRERFDYAVPTDVSTNSGDVIRAGTRVNVYLVHFDNTAGNTTRRIGQVRFDRPLLGVITMDSTLAASDPAFAVVGTTYPVTAARGPDAAEGDSVSVQRDGITVNLGAATGVDQIRIITPANPEPTAMLAAPRAGELSYSARRYDDRGASRALGAMVQLQAPLPHTSCIRLPSGEITVSTWVDGDPVGHADFIYQVMEGRLAERAGIDDGTGLLAAQGIRREDVAAAIELLLDGAATLDTGIELAPPFDADDTGELCGSSIVHVWRPNAAPRNMLPLLAAFATASDRLPIEPSATSLTNTWYDPAGGQLGVVGAAGAAQMLRFHLLRVTPSFTQSTQATDAALRALDGTIGARWSEWRRCDSAAGCGTDTPWSGRWTIYERPDTGEMLPGGTAVLVRNERDARCLVAGGEPLGTGGCAHVTSDTTRYRVLEQLPDILGPGATCIGAVGPYCRRQFRIPSIRSASRGDRGYVLWCEMSGSTSPCESYQLVDMVFLGQPGAVHTLGGEIREQLEQLFSVDPADPSQPMFNSLGLENELVPPLENELISDGDAHEDSYRHYLSYARAAQEQATAALDDARQSEMVIREADESRALAEASADLAYQEEVQAGCGGGTTASATGCTVARAPVATLGPDLGLVPDPGPEPEGLEVAGTYLSCPELVATFQANYQPGGRTGEDLGDYVNEYLTAGLRCTRWLALTAIYGARVREMPQPVFDEIALHSRALRGDAPTGIDESSFGTFASYGGEMRVQLIELYTQLEQLREVIQDFEMLAFTTLQGVDVGTARINELDGSWWAQAKCWIMAGAAVVATAAAVIGAIVATGGLATIGLALGAAATGGAAFVQVSNAIEGACSAEGREGQRQATELFTSTVASMEELGDLLNRAHDAIRFVALADAGFDSLEDRIAIATARRDVAIALASSGLENDPTWRALAGVRRARANRALHRAQRLAFIARRAIEVRLAVDMDYMTADELQTPPPASWANDVFVAHESVTEASPGSGAPTVAVPTQGEAIADYLQHLEDFVFGYPFTRRFSEGDDMQILGMTGGTDAAALAAGASAVEMPAHRRLLFVCRNHSTPLAGGVPGWVLPDANGELPPPCGVFDVGDGTSVDFGGVERVFFAFELPGEISPSSSVRLAAGSYNYRVDRVAVNLVGRALVDCTRASRPSECWGDGNVQYTLRHEPDVLLQSYEGDLLSIRMERGVIEHARALADERWLTNPMSSVDATLIAPYERTELRGRPLGGTYVLEIHPRPEIDWRHLEDVQVLLRYHYWTRQR
ncbi:hypothetical protein [Sandaracinus amylolyticus]|uniref:hypothetical protein n=1 Tax=Sandaracinus amylolyticus TaxID=927083 RepID=UPI001F1ADA71|nr:hypothetical protein [Sandaracinus amylolyticus]UJR85585.1 Hypothetical protein I5071_76650 [Sandaracinus amylolyticus]